MTLKQFFLLCVFFFCCVYCDKNDSRSCFLHKTKLNYDLVDADKLRVFDVTEKDISYGYGMAEVAGRIGVSAATLGMGCAAAQTSNVMRATVATVDTLEGLGAGVGLVKGGADMAENGVNSKNLAQVGSSLLTFIGLGNKACFTAGTQVVVGVVDYSGEGCGVEYVTANIEDIKVGDYILTQDVETGEVSLKEVTDTFIRTSDHIRYLTTIDEESDEQVIETTDSHPVWVVTDSPDLSRAAQEVVVENGTTLIHENLAVTEHGYYVETKDLRVGDVFIGANGELTTLTGTERVEYQNGITVYNFTVADNHNYFVIGTLEAYQNGASVVLVHNAGYGDTWTVTSSINQSKGLVRAAEEAGTSVQPSIDRLVGQLQQGNLNPGIGTKHLFNGIFEARAKDGARVYFRNIENGVEIVGKSNKANQDMVIGLLRRLYEK